MVDAGLVVEMGALLAVALLAIAFMYAILRRAGQPPRYRRARRFTILLGALWLVTDAAAAVVARDHNHFWVVLAIGLCGFALITGLDRLTRRPAQGSPPGP